MSKFRSLKNQLKAIQKLEVNRLKKNEEPLQHEVQLNIVKNIMNKTFEKTIIANKTTRLVSNIKNNSLPETNKITIEIEAYQSQVEETLVKRLAFIIDMLILHGNDTNFVGIIGGKDTLVKKLTGSKVSVSMCKRLLDCVWSYDNSLKNLHWLINLRTISNLTKSLIKDNVYNKLMDIPLIELEDTYNLNECDLLLADLSKYLIVDLSRATVVYNNNKFIISFYITGTPIAANNIKSPFVALNRKERNYEKNKRCEV